MKKGSPSLSLLISDSFSSRRNGGRAAFTTTELMVVFSIIAVLLGVLFPSLGAMRERSNTVKCAANLRKLHSGAILYANDHGGWLPISTNTGGSFFREAGPYMMIDSAYPKSAADYPLFHCPKRPAAVIRKMWEEGRASSIGYGSYAQNEHVCGIPPNGRPRQRLSNFTRPSGIWMLGDANGFGAIYHPVDLPPYGNRAAFDHGRKIQLAMVDGHVRLVSEEEFRTNANDLFGKISK